MYTYAFLKTPTRLLQLPTGIRNGVQVISQSRLAAVVEPDLVLEELQEDAILMQAVLAHDRVIRELFLQTTILPLRFGTSFLSLQGLLTHLDANQQTYFEKLNQFEGKAEYPLKLLPLPLPEISIAPDLKGKDYFLAKKKSYQTQLENQQQQRDELQGLMQAIAQSYPQFVTNPTQAEIETVYLLVDAQQASQLQQALRAWQEQCPSWQISLGEALPPYHFLGD